jgi:hypothetical protein
MQQRPLLARGYVEANRRRGLVLAAAEIAHEFSVREITVTGLCQMGHSARKTFYDLFPNVDACLRYGCAESLDRLFAPFRELDAEGEWLARVEKAIAGFYTAVAAEPLLAELLLVHSFGLPRRAGDADFEAGVAAVVQLLAGGRLAAEGYGRDPPPPLAEEYLGRMIVSLAALKLCQEDSEGLLADVRQMAMLVGNAYLGNERASLILGAAPSKL